MRNLKRALSLALAMVMVLSMMVIGGSAASAEFTDADELQYPEAAAVMTGLRVIEGIPDGDGFAFTPGKTLSRAEAAVMLTLTNYWVEGAT